MRFPLSFLLFVATLLLLLVLYARAQVAKRVRANYNRSQHAQLYREGHFPVPDHISIEHLAQRGAVGLHNFACMTGTSAGAHSANRHVYDNLDRKELRASPNFLANTTYWINDYLHVGHVHYDIVLLQVLQSTRINRIVMQRFICHGTLCSGLGTMDSFYKGYYAALFRAFNHEQTPIYVRWGGREKQWSPLWISPDTEDNYLQPEQVTNTDKRAKQPIAVDNSMCFARLIRRADLDYGHIPTVSASAVQQFKAAAYSLVTDGPPLKTYFSPDPPYRILFSHRGPRASRRIANQDAFIDTLHRKFPAPAFEVRVMNNSDPQLTYKQQMRAVAEAHVVITNHGAFEGNMIYMRNGSLLMEVFGHYGNNEIHTFHRLALMFGLYYARYHVKTLTDHYAEEFNMTYNDMEEITNQVLHYFDVKPYLLNLQPAEKHSYSSK